MADGLKSAETALALDENDGWAHGIMGQNLVIRGRDQEGENHFRRALALNPNDADVAALLTPMRVYQGRWEEGLEWIDTARQLNPYPGRWYYWYRGFALYSGRDYEQAIDALREMTPHHCRHFAYLMASLAQAGRLDEARDEMVRLEESWRAEQARFSVLADVTLSDAAREWAERYRKPEDGEHLLDGLRKAGLDV